MMRPPVRATVIAHPEAIVDSPLNVQAPELANNFPMCAHWNSMQFADAMESLMETNAVQLPQEYPSVKMVHAKSRAMSRAVKIAIVKKDSFAIFPRAALRMEHVPKFPACALWNTTQCAGVMVSLTTTNAVPIETIFRSQPPVSVRELLLNVHRTSLAR